MHLKRKQRRGYGTVKNIFILLTINKMLNVSEKKRNNKRKQTTFPLGRPLTLKEDYPSVPFVPFPEDLFENLFPKVKLETAIALLRTNKDINQRLNRYLSDFHARCKKETQWDLRCLDPQHKDCLEQCVSFGLARFLNKARHLLNVPIRVGDVDGHINAVYLKAEYKREQKGKMEWEPFAIRQMEFSLWIDHFNSDEDDEEWIYTEEQNTDIKGKVKREQIKEEREILEEERLLTDQAKMNIISRAQHIIQHFGAEIAFGLYFVPAEQDEIPNFERGKRFEVFAESKTEEDEDEQYLGVFTVATMDLIELERKFSVPPQIGKLLSSPPALWTKE